MALLAWGAALCPVARADYVSEMPAPQEVLARITGTDRLDSWVRQYAAFNRLNTIMGMMAGSREFDPPPAQLRVHESYSRARGDVESQITKSAPAGDPMAWRRQWFQRELRYETSAAFERELLAKDL